MLCYIAHAMLGLGLYNTWYVMLYNTSYVMLFYITHDMLYNTCYVRVRVI